MMNSAQRLIPAVTPNTDIDTPGGNSGPRWYLGSGAQKWPVLGLYLSISEIASKHQTPSLLIGVFPPRCG